jgi:hypothetical protein
MSMGEENKRGRTTKELEDIFRTCSMKTCVTMNHEGKIFFCSRQMSAYETGIYPDPEKQEYIDVRNDSDLKTSLRMFYELPYISTCDYCDGISCATTKRVGTATQILDKKYFLELLGCYEILKNEHCEGEERQQAIMSVYDIIRANTEKLYDLPECTELIEALSKAVGGKTAETYKELLEKLRRLIDTLTRDYNFAISKNVPFADVGCKKGFPNLIRVDMYGKDADILLTDADIMEAVSEKYPVDSFVYNRLYVESKLERLKKQQITCVICGLSYTQYGILEKRMPVSAVNLSVTGKDIPYTVLLAERAIELNPDIKTIIFPMTYYQGCYDMSADDIALHREVVSRVNIPILSNKRNYGGEVIGKNGYREGRTLQIYDRLLALEQARTVRDNQLKEVLKEKEYFNEMNTYPAFGGLKFDFRELDTEEKYKSAKITAEHNERVCTEEGYLEVKKYLERFLDAMKKEGREVLIFVPPMTAYLYEAYHKELKEFYYDKIVSLLYEYENVRFADLALDSAFTETDFCDFEHLNKKGAEKLTEKIGEFLL